MKTCLKCNYTRLEADTAPDYECPKCGRVYAKIEAEIAPPNKKRLICYNQNSEAIFCRCECGNFFRFNRQLVAIDGKKCSLKQESICEKCGTRHALIDDYDAIPKAAVDVGSVKVTSPTPPKRAFLPEPPPAPHADRAKLVCTKCGSDQLSGDKRGYKVGRSLIAGALFGGIGLAAGLFGRRKIIVTCLKCGHQWAAGSE